MFNPWIVERMYQLARYELSMSLSDNKKGSLSLIQSCIWGTIANSNGGWGCWL